MKYILVIMVALFFASCSSQFNYLSSTKTPEEIKQVENRLEKVYNLLLGHFTNEVQAAKETALIYSPQEFIGVPIWTKRVGEYWVYVTWMQLGKPEIPLIQGVWHITRKDRETIDVVIYEIPNKQDYIYAWKEENPLADLTPNDLIYKDTCGIAITRASTNEYWINGEPCKRDISAVIKHIQSKIKLLPEKVVVYSTFMNKKKEKVYAYDKGLEFIRISKDKPRY